MTEKLSFEKVYGINVNDKTEQKGQLTYLSWAWAWAEFKKLYPDATYKVDQFGGTFCTGNGKLGYMVRTEVTADGLTYEMWLPIMDGRNQTIFEPKMTEVNKTIMRCLTKNLAMFGLGLYIYAGEDLPECEDGDNGEQKPAPRTTQQQPQRQQGQPQPVKASDGNELTLDKAEKLSFKNGKNANIPFAELSDDTLEWAATNLNGRYAEGAAIVLSSRRAKEPYAERPLASIYDNDDIPF